MSEVANRVLTRKQYFRVPDGNNGRGAPIGLVVCRHHPETNSVQFGYSLCHKNDRFNRSLANSMAMNRLESNEFCASLNDFIEIRDTIFRLPNSLQLIAYQMLAYIQSRPK